MRPNMEGWLAAAGNSLDAVRRALIADPDINAAMAAYYCHQAAERMIKTILFSEGIAVPGGDFGHDISRLHSQIPDGHPLRDDAAQFVFMTPWAMVLSHPSEVPVSAEPAPGEETLNRAFDRLMTFYASVRDHTVYLSPPSL